MFGNVPVDDGVHPKFQLPPTKLQQSGSDIFAKSMPAVTLVHLPEFFVMLPHTAIQVQPAALHAGSLSDKSVHTMLGSVLVPEALHPKFHTPLSQVQQPWSFIDG